MHVRPTPNGELNVVDGRRAVVISAFAAWFLAPRARLLGPDFEPTLKDDLSVVRAQQPGMAPWVGRRLGDQM